MYGVPQAGNRTSGPPIPSYTPPGSQFKAGNQDFRDSNISGNPLEIMYKKPNIKTMVFLKKGGASLGVALKHVFIGKYKKIYGKHKEIQRNTQKYMDFPCISVYFLIFPCVFHTLTLKYSLLFYSLFFSVFWT